MSNSRKIKSSSITVFPTTKRQKGNRSSKLLTESNLVGLINNILDVNSFVITNTSGPLNNTDSIEFNILGYYFRISSISEIMRAMNITNMSNIDSIYANIYFMRSGDFKELYGTDSPDSENTDEYFYDGVLFTENINDSNASGFLKILEKSASGEAWQIPDNSKIKFMQRSISNLDCGVI